MVRLAGRSVRAVTAEIQNLGKLFQFRSTRAASAGNLVVQRNTANAFRMEENVDPIASAPTAATENENQNSMNIHFQFYYTFFCLHFYEKIRILALGSPKRV